MFNIMNRKSTLPLGIKEYITPKTEFNPVKLKQENLNYQYATFRKKPPIPRGPDMKAIRKSYTQDIEKKSRQVPAPWKYDYRESWIKGPKSKSFEPLNRSVRDQSLKQKKRWRAPSGENGNIELGWFKKPRPGKLNLKVRKKLYSKIF